MKSLNFPVLVFRFRLLGLAALLLATGFTGAALATQPIYQNYSVLNYSIPGTPPPVIDAFSFVNYNQFNVTFENIGNNAQFYEPMNTVNYTNNSSGIDTGVMTVNSPWITNSFFGSLFGINYNSVGVGFQFDTQTTNTIPHQEAGTFYNSGNVRCDSFLDGNNVLNFEGTPFFEQANVGQCLVWATNIFCPGTIETSQNGLIQLTGQNVDLTRSVLDMEVGLSQGLVTTATNVEMSINSEGEGFVTNEWNPFTALTPTNAASAYPDTLALGNSTPYFSVDQSVGTNGQTSYLVRAVFIENDNTNTAYSVYMTPAAFGNAGALIQWTGTYIDPITSQLDSSYLYMFHYFISDDSTNFLPVLGLNTTPNTFFDVYYNYLWAQSSSYLGLGTPSAAGFDPVFNSALLTNKYEYFNGQMSGVTVSTNASSSNPSGSLTNLPARIQITAARELNLALAQISGQNYTAITATNQFDGSPGAIIESPYSDLNLGVTNGTLTISNLLVADIPTWSGVLQEWSTRWTYTDPSSNNWDFRVMLVRSSLTPTLSPQVQNLTLNATNLIISDVLNVFGSVFANAQSLTLTTNVMGNGATSPDGELNLQEENPFSWNWNAAFPNLLWITNDGAIRMPNYSDFYGNAQITNVTPAVPAVQATAKLSGSGANNVAVNSTVTVGADPYIFVRTLANKTPFQVKLGTTLGGSMNNLIAAINRGAGSGTSYSTNTPANSSASAGLLANNAFTVTANTNNYPGTLGNGISVATTAANLAWNGSVLSGGVNGVSAITNLSLSPIPYGAIINEGYMSDQGATIWAKNFVNGGVISNNPGAFLLNSVTATLTNGLVTAGGDVSFVANTLLVSNLTMQAGRSLTLQVTNSLYDGGVTNGNIWTVGATNGTGGNGLLLPLLPTNNIPGIPGINNLLGTAISLVSPPPNKLVASTWAGLDYGVSTLGYNTNNVAIGQLILNSLAPNSVLSFAGPPGSTNKYAIYVDQLILENYASYANNQGFANIPTLFFNTNIVIYYADAQASSTVTGGPLEEVSYLLNGSNTNHLIWVPEYNGYFSSTNIVYPGEITYPINIGLALAPTVSSIGNGLPNYLNPYPLFEPSQVNFKFTLTNVPPEMGLLTWDSIPSATNTVLYTTNLMSQNWTMVTNFVSSSQALTPLTWPINNALLEQLHMTSPHGYYRVRVSPNSSVTYPPTP